MSSKDVTPEVSSKYGAPMGRNTGPHYLTTEGGRITLFRVRINSGGYDSGGAYWGLGAPLWYVGDPDGNGWFFRASGRDAAKAAILKDWPDAKFYR